MSNASSFSSASDPNGYSSAQAERIADSIWTMFELLSVEDRQLIVDKLLKATRVIPASRAGDVLATIVRFLPKRPEWTASQIKQELIDQGVTADQRVIFNAIGYLARKGSIQKHGNGRYTIDGIGILLPGEFGL